VTHTEMYQCEQCDSEIPEDKATIERYPLQVTLAFCPDCTKEKRAW